LPKKTLFSKPKNKKLSIFHQKSSFSTHQIANVCVKNLLKAQNLFSSEAFSFLFHYHLFPTYQTTLIIKFSFLFFICFGAAESVETEILNFGVIFLVASNFSEILVTARNRLGKG
jgi:hypothetical protein